MSPELIGVLVVAAVSGFGWLGKFIIERLVARGLDQRFDKRLADHKHALTLTAEQARFEYQRDLANFNLSATRRHAAAESVYAKARIAHGAVAGLFGLSERPTFQEYNRSDINSYLVSRSVPEGMRTEILADWDQDRTTAVSRLDEYLRMLDIAESQNELSAAQNETFLNELYLSDEAGAALATLFAMLRDWVYIAKNPSHGLTRKYEHEDLNNALAAVRSQLRAELMDGPGAAVSVADDPVSPPALPEAT